MMGSAAFVLITRSTSKPCLRSGSKAAVHAVSPSFVISHASSLARRSLEPVLDAGVVFLSHQHCPGDPNRLIRHRHDPFVEASSIDHCLEPERPWIALRLQTERDGASAKDKLATQIVIERRPTPARRDLPPVEYWRGTRRTQAAISRPDRNCRGSPMLAASAVATIGPTPGRVIKRRHVLSSRQMVKALVKPLCARLYSF
jgi:hypothetical protein